MTDVAQSLTAASQRPPSPTELSYTQLVKLAPPNSGPRSVGIQIPATNVSMAPSAMSAVVSRAVPPSINVIRESPTTSSSTFHASRAPAPMSSHVTSLSSANSTSNLDTNFVNMPHPQPSRTVHSEPERYHKQATNQPVINHIHDARSTQVQDRVNNIAMQLEAIEAPNKSSNALNFMSNANKSQTSLQRLQDIQQFIAMLQGMQNTVSCTIDEQHRKRKSQALDLLLTMFESVLAERNARDETTHNSSQLSIQLEERLNKLRCDSEQVQFTCKKKDEELMQLHHRIQNLQLELQRLTNENDELQKELSRSQDECHQERRRAEEAEIIATESENVRNTLFSNYGRLIEENVEMERTMEESNSEKDALNRELEFRKDEIVQLQNQCQLLTQQLQQKDLDMVEMEKKFDVINSKLASHRQSLDYVNTNRHRLQDELHASQRNATSMSEQLLKLRDQYGKLQKEYDAKRRNSVTNTSENGNLHILLQEEQRRRKDLEGVVFKCEARELAAQEQIQKLARANAELKTKVNEMNARLENVSISEPVFYDGWSDDLEAKGAVSMVGNSVSGRSTSVRCLSSQQATLLDRKVIPDEHGKGSGDQSNLLDYLHPDE